MSPIDFEISQTLKEIVTTLLGLRQDVQAIRLDLHSTVTKSDLQQTERNIMSALSDFLAKQTAYNTRNAASIDALVTTTDGIVGDVKNLTDQIAALQASAGTVTPEDQAIIDSLETQGDALATKLEGVQAALAQLDNQTPPVAPPTV